MMHYEGFLSDLDKVVSHTGVERYRDLTNPDHDSYDYRYVLFIRDSADEIGKGHPITYGQKKTVWDIYLSLPLSHPLKESNASRLCPYRDPCDCQHIECGFYGEKRQASECLGCAIKYRFVPK